MDVIELSAVVTMAFAVGVGIQHLYDRYAPNGLYRRTERRAAGIGTEVGAAVKVALIESARELEASAGDVVDPLETKFTELQATLNGLPAAFGAEIGKLAEAQAKAIEEEAKKVENSMGMSMVRSVGVDKQAQAAATAAIAEGILGNAMPVLRMVVPGIADQLEENPQLIFALIENPYFKKYVLPRIQQFLPTGDGTPTPGSGASSGSGWG